MRPGVPAVRIASLAAGGDGVGRLPDGRAVFVPRTVPGDLVDVGDLDVRRTFARGRVARLVEPSADRTDPRCRHFVADDCGGCVWQHVAYEAQLAAKARIVRDAIERIAKVPTGDVGIVPNPRPWGWRSRLALTIDGRTGACGLHRLGRADEVFALDRCEIAAPALQRLWDALRPHARKVPAPCERLTLREDEAGGLHVVVHGTTSWARAAEVAAALESAGSPATLWVVPDGGAARVVGGPPPAAGATAFEQVDAAMGEVVRRHAVSGLGDVRGRRVWDLYAGTGATTALLAAGGASVESVELDPAAVDASRRRGPVEAVVRHEGRVEDVLPSLPEAPLAVANPPRAGLGPDVTSAVAARPPERLVYVSCDPATLARDVARLAPGLRLASVRAFDSFPQTAHVETVAVLARGQS